MKTATKIIAGLLVLLVVGAGIFIYHSHNDSVVKAASHPMEISGNVEVKEVDVNVKVGGKVARISVDEGDQVSAGQVLAEMEADNIEAKSSQAQAAMEAANAQLQKAKKGARPQQLQQAKDLVVQAKAAYDLSKTTYARLDGLFKEGVLPRQKLDMARTDLEVSQARYQSAVEQLDLVKEGAQQEDLEAASALVKQASAVHDEVQSYLDDAKVKAPVSGIVTQKTVEPGELVSTGMPLFTISNWKDAWVEMKVRETMINHFNLGQIVPVRVVGVPGRVYQGKITYIESKPSFATERAYQERGEKDLVAYGVKLKLDNDDLKLRPGMTATISLKK